MSRLGALAAGIPLLPTKRSAGRRLIRRALGRRLGDDDVLGLVRDQEGWDPLPCNYVTDAGETWLEPVDGSDRYPADGVGGDPGTLFDVPVAIGYRNFGAVRELPKTSFGRDVILHEDDVVDVPGDGSGADPDPSPVERLEGHVPHIGLGIGAAGVFAGIGLFWWFGLLFWALGVGLLGAAATAAGADAWRAGGATDAALERGVKWIAGDADALVLVKDTDDQWALERADYELEDQLYRSRDSGNPYDAEAVGAQPGTLCGVPVGVANGRFPLLMAPLLPRLGRNHSKERYAGEPRLVEQEDGSTTIRKAVDAKGGGYYDGAGQPVALPDGGSVEDAPEPVETTPEYNDIEVRERAFVSPDDVKLLGVNEGTQEKIAAMLERVKASQNSPGGELKDQMLKYGGYVMMLIIGWWMGQQAGGGGGGDGGSSVGSAVPLSADPVALVGDTIAWAPVAVATGVIGA